MRPGRIFLTIDAEFWDSPQFFGLARDKSRAHGDAGCREVLDLLRRLSAPGTFFVTGEFAEAHPSTAIRILAEGHEVASHSYAHERFSTLTAARRREEVVRSKEVLEERLGTPVTGFRAPGNVMGPDHFQLLREAGYRYDSSLHPALMPHQPWNVLRSSRPFTAHGVVEIPLTTLGGLPVSWVWMRNCGTWLPRAAVRQSRLLGRDAVFYLHSWEFEPLPSVPGLPSWIVRRTGPAFLAMLEGFVRHFQHRGFVFERMRRLADEHLDHRSRP